MRTIDGCWSNPLGQWIGCIAKLLLGKPSEADRKVSGRGLADGRSAVQPKMIATLLVQHSEYMEHQPFEYPLEAVQLSPRASC